MDISTTLNKLHLQAKQNRWLHYFAIFNRVALAFGFVTAGMVKIAGERFASGLSANHPMGHYLVALHQTGFYYTFIGIAQVAAALLLLIPRTAVLGALLYFPIIVNICILSIAVRFEGSLISSTLMVLANLYLLCWYYDRIKYILPFKQPAATNPQAISNKFPARFFAAVAAIVIALVLVLPRAFNIMPRNSITDCRQQCNSSKNPNACNVFCDCIHHKGLPLQQSLDEYQKALKDKK
jgi:hypothetical protein